MSNQVKTIDVDQIWMRGEKDPCYKYTLYAKVNKKYIQPIYKDMVLISKRYKNQGIFTKSATINRNKIYSTIEYMDRHFRTEDFEELLQKDLSLVEFIHKAHAIRKRND